MTTLLAHVIVSVALLAASVVLLVLTSDAAMHTMAVGLISLIAGYWLQSPVQQVATQAARPQMKQPPGSI